MIFLIISTISIIITLSLLQRWLSQNQNKQSQQKDKPSTTFALKAINTILRPLFILQPNEKFQPLNLNKLKQKAMKETNLYKFSEDWDERPYRETIDVVNSTNYSPVGKLLMYNFFLSQLKELLMMEDAFRKDEALREYCDSDGGTLSDERKENRPLFVLGLPRTGTTFLHSLLALDPKVRAPRKWELDNPTPRDDTNAEKDKEIRIKLSQSNNLNAAKTFAPQMLQLHDSSDVTRAEECIFVLSLFAPVKLITFLFPDHWDTVIGWDWVRVYRNYWKILQMWEYYEMKTKECYPNKGSSSSTNKRWAKHPHLSTLTLQLCLLSQKLPAIVLEKRTMHLDLLNAGGR